MDLPLDLFRTAIRWLHLLAAVAWIGGSIFSLAVLRPAIKDSLPAVDKRFGDLVQLAMIVLLVTGVVATFDRLQLQPVSGYVVALGIKIALAVWMFLLAADVANRTRRKALLRRAAGIAGPQPRSSTTRVILGLGLVVLLLSDVLRAIGPR